MGLRFPQALSRAAARAAGSRFAKPAARAAAVAMGLILLAFIGRTSAARGARAATASGVGSVAIASAVVAAAPAPSPSAQPTSPAKPPASSASSEATPSPRARASPDDPVVLNTATEADLRRLPGIGPKRAGAILALRARLGRFRAVEDLLKVKGVGRATLRRLRPLVRLDAPPP